MYDKISLKTKIISFIIIAIIALVSIAYNNKGKFHSNISSTNNKKEIAVDKSALINDSKEKQIDDARVKELEEKQLNDKKAAEKQRLKDLDDQWQSGYVAYNEKRDNSSCIKIMDDIIAKDDKYYKAYTLKGIAECYTSSVYYADGIKNLDKALELKPDYGYGRYNKALALELYGKYPEAIEAYKSALEVEDYIWSYYGISSIYGRYGDAKNCVYYLNFAIKQDPEEIKTLVKEEHDFDNVRSSVEFINATK